MSNQEKKARESLWESVVFRIFAICFILVILPLILHSFLLYKARYEEKIRDVLKNLETLSFADHYADLQWARYSQITLETLSKDNPSSEELARLVAKEGFTFVIHLVKKSPTEYECVAASQKEYLKGENHFLKPLSTVKINQSAYFGIFDPFSKQPLDLIIFSHNGIDYYLIGEPIKAWVTEEESYLKIKQPFYLTVLRNDNVILYSTDPSFSLKNTQFITVNDLGKPPKHLFKSKRPSLGVQIPSIISNYSLCITFYKEGLQKKIFFNIAIHALFFFLFYVIIGGSIALFITYRMQKPLHNLYETMRAVQEGKFDSRYKPLFLGFEINRVGTYFNSTVEHLVEHMKHEQTERGKRLILERDLHIAENIQKSLFPKTVSFPNLDIAARFLPAKIVSGDFYDIYVANDKLLFLVADASGKGIPASLYSLSVRSYIRSNFCNTQNPKEIIEKTNQLFLEDTKENGDFVTLLISIYDMKTHTLSYTSSGHNPGFIKRKEGPIEELETTGIALGVAPIVNVEIKETVLNQGDLVFLYTDGLVEAQNQKHEFFTKKHLDAFASTHPISSSSEFLDALLAEVNLFCKGADQFDDITLLGLKRLK